MVLSGSSGEGRTGLRSLRGGEMGEGSWFSLSGFHQEASAEVKVSKQGQEEGREGIKRPGSGVETREIHGHAEGPL